MLQKKHIKSCSKQSPNSPFSEKEKDYLDMICNFIVDDIINKVNNDKKKSNRLRKD